MDHQPNILVNTEFRNSYVKGMFSLYLQLHFLRLSTVLLYWYARFTNDVSYVAINSFQFE